MGAPNRHSQVNIRLAAAEAELLQAVAFVDQRAATEILRPVVLRYLQQRAKDPDVADAAAVLARRRAKAVG